MKLKIGLILFAAIIMSLSFSSCLKRAGEKMMDQLETLEAELSEGEESGTQFGLTDTCDEVRKGVHLVLSYNAEAKLFRGSVENTTGEILENVRLEVHLSNGVELEPNELAELPPGEIIIVDYDATGEDFETWSAHAEVGSSELGEGHEEEGEQDDEGGDEHN